MVKNVLVVKGLWVYVSGDKVHLGNVVLVTHTHSKGRGATVVGFAPPTL